MVGEDRYYRFVSGPVLARNTGLALRILCDERALTMLLPYMIHTYLCVPRVPAHFGLQRGILLLPVVPIIKMSICDCIVFYIRIIITRSSDLWRYNWFWSPVAVLYRLPWIYRSLYKNDLSLPRSRQYRRKTFDHRASAKRRV